MSTDHLAPKVIGPWDTSSRCKFALALPHVSLEGGYKIRRLKNDT